MDDKYNELYEKLSRLQWLLRRQHMQGHMERGPFADPTRGQGRVLAMLKLQPQISTKDLSYLLGIRQQSLNELLNKLEKAGYVERTPSDADRRVMMVRLTEKGRSAQQAPADYSGIFGCLSPEEQAAFAGYLDRVIAALEAELGVEEDEDVMDWMRAARSRMGDEMFEHLRAFSRGERFASGPRGEQFYGGFGGFCGHGPHGGRRAGGPSNPPEPDSHCNDEEAEGCHDGDA